MSLVLVVLFPGDFSKSGAKAPGRQRELQLRGSRAQSRTYHLQFVLSCCIHDTTCAMAYNNYPRMHSYDCVSHPGHMLIAHSSGIVWQAAVWLPA